VERLFPGVVVDGAVDRIALGRRVFGDRAALRRLEGLLHPFVQRSEQQFLRRARGRREPLAVLDIPLLFETGGEVRCDAVIVVSAPRFVQEGRVLRRLGMTREKLGAVRARQMSDRDKRRRADFVVPTGLDRGFALRRLVEIVRLATARDWIKPRRRRRPRRGKAVCAKSSLTPKPPGSVPPRGIESSN
jgi:dephospho-CoA kinase